MYFKLLRSSWDDFALCAGVLAGFFLVAHIVTAVVLAFFSDGTSLMISGMILPIVSAFLILIYSLSYSGFQFSHLVRLGCTRRRSLALTLGAAAAVALFCMLLSALLAWLELSLAPSLWQAITGCDGAYYGRDGWVALDNVSPNALFVELFVMPLWGWFVIPLATMAMGVLCGTILHRFGKKGMWALWVLWMSVCFVPQILNPYLDRMPDLTTLGIGGGVALVPAFGWAVWYLLRAPVPE